MGPTTGKRKFKVYQDEVKTRHTSHWDWDYLSTEEIEALLDEQREREAVAARAKAHAGRPGLIARLLGLLRRTNRRS
jgi:hypothetical protein